MLLRLINLNAISELEETVFDRLLAFAIVLERRSHHIVQDINHFEIFGQSLLSFTLAVKPPAALFQHFGVLQLGVKIVSDRNLQSDRVQDSLGRP